MRVAAALLIAAALAGCHRATPADQGLDALDNQLTENIVVNQEGSPVPAARPRPTPVGRPAATPHRSQSAAADDVTRRVPACRRALAYDDRWATRLPAGVALYPGARVSEAAGTDTGGCALRVVSFTSRDPVDRVAGWYRTSTQGSGYAIEHRRSGDQQQIDGSGRGGSFVLYLGPGRGGGTDADLIVDTGD